MTRVAAVSFDPLFGELDENRRRGAAAIEAAVAAGADLIVLPELSNSGYMFESAEEAAAVAIRPDDPLLQNWARIATDAHAVLIAGFCERGDTGALYNSAILIDGEQRFVYRKVHLWDRDKLVFTPGADAPAVLETSLGRIAMLVCYDLEFPEMPRALALAGADLIAVPTNWPLIPRPEGEHPPEVIAAMAAARASHAYVVCADRSGVERGVPLTGGTSIVNCEGWVIASTATEGMAIAELDLRAAREKSIGPRNDVFTDRRPDIYGALPDPRPEVLDNG